MPGKAKVNSRGTKVMPIEEKRKVFPKVHPCHQGEK